MSALRLPLLGAFVGGCLCSAVMLGVWRMDAGAPASVPAPKQRANTTKVVTAALIPTPPPSLSEAAVEPPRAPSAALHDQAQAAEAEPPTPAGSPVSDILTDLETAYRRRLANAATEEALARQATAAATNAVIARAEAPREAAQAVVPVAAVAAARAPAPAVVAPAAVAPAAVAPVAAQVAAAPAPAVQEDQRPTAVHIGDINNINNTYVTNIRQGDVYLMQQQVAMMQYLQLLGMSSLAGRTGFGGMGVPAAAAPTARGMAAQTPQYRQFPSTLTNPDNPWGFTFAPPNLVH
jgi:hypothetical protein